MMENGKGKLVCIARLSGKQDGEKEREMKACVFSCFCLRHVYKMEASSA